MKVCAQRRVWSSFSWGLDTSRVGQETLQVKQLLSPQGPPNQDSNPQES